MTIEAKRRAIVRRGNAPVGNVSRGAGGQITMITFNGYKDAPQAPVVFVNNIGGIYRVDDNNVKVTMVATLPNADGVLESVAAVHLIYDERTWVEIGEMFRFAYAEFKAGGLHGDGGKRRTAQ